jgi:hemerythrin
MEFKWDSSLIVGEKTIDAQHEKLFNQINKINQLISSPDLNIGTMREVNHFLYVYLKEHFSYEENFMLKNNCPGLKAHIKKHQEFIKFYDDFQVEIKEKTTTKYFSLMEVKQLLSKVEAYLGKWLVNHIKKVDKKDLSYALKPKAAKSKAKK